MYPLLLTPCFREYLWGGERLKKEFGFKSELEKIAESWMLSCRSDADNIVANGELKGKPLSQVLEIWGERALGKRSEKYEYFPLLIKLIDAKQKLSVQVHPDDEYALKNEGEYGKTEIWYVVDCDEGAELIYGFKENISKEEFKNRIENNTLTEICNSVPVKKGDVFFIPSGILHAIGEGILIAEVQQNSNTTYRVFDYGRKDANGNTRPLHIEKALDVTKCEKLEAAENGNKEMTVDGVRELAVCNYFNVNLLNIDNEYRLFNEESFISLVVLDGSATIVWQDEALEVKKGDSIFIPSGLSVSVFGKAEILCSEL